MCESIFMRASLPPDPRFALFGISGVYNYGCEAIVRGTEIALRTEWPDCSIVYVSMRWSEDRKRLTDTNVQVIPRMLAKRGSARWFINGVLRRVSLGCLFPSESADWIDDVDCIFLIGGDLYTLPPNDLVAPERRFLYTHLIDLGEWMMARGKRLVIWGASVGPFEAWPSAKALYARHLRRVDLILAREPLTIEYLASLGIKRNVQAVADPAFLSPSAEYEVQRQCPDLPLVGVNLSPWSTRFIDANHSSESIIVQQAKALAELSKRLNIEILLVPHAVMEDNPEDDDMAYLAKIYKVLATLIPERIGMISADIGARKLKGALAQCDLVLAARMHCGIQAISVGTPVLFLGYSSKALGMVHYVYRDDSFCLPLNALPTEGMVSRVDNLLRNRATIRSYLQQMNRTFVQQAHKAARCLRPVLGHNGAG